MGFSIKFDLVYGHGPQRQDAPPTSCYRETAAAQGQVETGFAGTKATPLVIGEGLGTLRQTRTHAPENKSVT